MPSHLRDDIDYMYQEKKEEEDSPALKIVSIQRLEDNIKKRAKKSKLLRLEKTRTTQESPEQQKLGSKNGKESSCLDILNDKQVKSHMKRLRYS